MGSIPQNSQKHSLGYLPELFSVPCKLFPLVVMLEALNMKVRNGSQVAWQGNTKFVGVQVQLSKARL